MLVRRQSHKIFPETSPTIFDLMGHSFAIHQLHRHIQRVARTNFTVIIEGATGTGKELVARLIHDYSDRADKPFVAIDCGAIPESLVESELFGYVKGAFTGAEAKKAGYFELAHGGTLFLDEIANLSPAVQTRLLRSMQERSIFPVGATGTIAVDIRLIVASNAVLEEEIEAGRFRADLFHRLNEFKIYLLSLTDRKDDILFLAERFCRETSAELGKDVKGFCPEAQAYLLEQAWPGNVRELRNAVRRAVLLSNGIIEPQHLRQHQRLPERLSVAVAPVSEFLRGSHDPSRGLHEIVQDTVAKLEKSLIQDALEKANGNKTEAAKTLHIGYKTLFRKLREYDLL